MRTIAVILLWHLSECSLQDAVYVHLAPEPTACFRLLNGTHQFGCQSDRDGSAGIVVRASRDDDLKLLSECWRSRYPEWTGGFAVIVDNVLFHDENFGIASRLRTLSCVSAVLIIDDGARDPFGAKNARSEDQTCPNRHSTFYQDGECGDWNSRGALLENGLALSTWAKPVVVLTNKTNIDNILDCHDRFNTPRNQESVVSYPFCAISIKVFSYAAGSTAVCMRRSRGATLELDNPVSLCDPLQDYNVFVSIPPKPAGKTSEESRKARYFVISTRMDSLTLVPEKSPGELSSLTSIISILAAARTVAHSRQLFEKAANKTDRRLLFSFLHGEAFDYIGSSRMVHDMSRMAFPATFDSKLSAQKEEISLNQIQAFVDVQQIGTHADHFFAHVDDRMYQQAKNLTDTLLSSSQSVPGVHLAIASSHRLPPSSLHSVLRHNVTLASFVLTQFEQKYDYWRINSMLDANSYSLSERAQIIEAVKLAAQALVEMAATYVGVGATSGLEVDVKYVQTLFKCFVESPDWWSCPLFISALKPIENFKALKREKTTYIGADGLSLIRNLVSGLAVEATGEKDKTDNVSDETQCEQLNHQQTLFRFVWQQDVNKNSSHCVRTTLFHTRALSPAFVAEDFNYATTPFSTWTEASYSISSTTKRPRSGALLFLVESQSIEYIVLLIGLLVAVLSTLVVSRLSEDTFVFDEGEPMAEAGEPL